MTGQCQMLPSRAKRSQPKKISQYTSTHYVQEQLKDKNEWETAEH